MKFAVALPAIVAAALLAAAPAHAGSNVADGHKFVMPGDVAWSPAPAVLPPGAEVSLLYGDPAKDGVFAMRIKFPKGYSVSPHTHARPEIVTVLSGALKLGLGETADPGKTTTLPADSFFVLDPGTAHFAYTDEETVIQLNSTGPWSVTYVNPADDPRQSQ